MHNNKSKSPPSVVSSIKMSPVVSQSQASLLALVVAVAVVVGGFLVVAKAQQAAGGPPPASGPAQSLSDLLNPQSRSLFSPQNLLSAVGSQGGGSPLANLMGGGPSKPKEEQTISEQFNSAYQQQQQNPLANAGQQAQDGIAAKLSEVAQGLKKIAENNPNLVPDVKQLFSQVTGKATGSQQASANLNPMAPSFNAGQQGSVSAN